MTRKVTVCYNENIDFNNFQKFNRIEYISKNANKF